MKTPQMSLYKYHRDGSQPAPNQIFVFGSNLSGIHGAGAAKAAWLDYGAVRGVGEGLTGHSYALPTVRLGIAGPLPLFFIKEAVDRFINYALNTPDHEYFVTRIGCGLAGYHDSEIAPLFKNVPPNCSLPVTWQPYLE